MAGYNSRRGVPNKLGKESKALEATPNFDASGLIAALTLRVKFLTAANAPVTELDAKLRPTGEDAG